MASRNPFSANRGITRRDFLNGILIGSGALLLDLPSPAALFAQTAGWKGYGGVGDYASSSGNTEEVVNIFDNIVKGRYDRIPDDAEDTGEVYDLVIVGGGLSGLGAAYQFRKKAGKKKTCLIIENHPVFGGHAKRNEFHVHGQRLIGPQASNSFVVINHPDVPGYELFEELGVPRHFDYQPLSPELRGMHFDRTNYGFALWHDISPNVGYFFEDAGDAQGHWVSDLWGRNLEGSPYSPEIRRDLISWRNDSRRHFGSADYRQMLDSMTYSDYLLRIMGLHPDVAKFADPILASGLGLGSDAISAYAAYQISMPGFTGFTGRGRERRLEESTWHSFPGGNDGFVRYLLKSLIPGAIQGKNTFNDILNGRIIFSALDNPGTTVRMRLSAMAVHIKHDLQPDKSNHVEIAYVKSGKVFRLRARAVVMASGSWINRKIIHDLPDAYLEALGSFSHSPVLVVNVALTNWRFLFKLGLTACRWFSGFGYTCNIRRQMLAGDYQPPLHPDKPAVLTFYVPYFFPGHPAKEQGDRGRREMLSSSYADYERNIIRQMQTLFGSAGFHAKKDIAGIILNRWLYAYLNPGPGFYFGKNGMPAPRSIIRQRYGRIAFGHSELDGHQNWTGAVKEGSRAALQSLEVT